MPCPKCGTATTPGAAFCAVCGINLAAQMPGQMPTGFPSSIPPPVMVMPSVRRTSGMAIAGFVLSFVCSLLGLIFSIMGHNECKRSEGMVDGDGLAIAGIVISAIGLLIWIIYIVAIIAVVGSAHHTHYY